MADKQANGLTELTSVDVQNDLVPVYDASEAGDEKLKKVQVDNLLHGYVLVQAFDWSNEAVNQAVTWNGENWPFMRVMCDLIAGTLVIRLNNDANSNYHIGDIHQNGSVLTSTKTTHTGFSFGGGASAEEWAVAEIALKNRGGNRKMIKNSIRYYSADTDRITHVHSTYWNNNADNVTSLQLVSTTNVTGRFGLYRWV